MRHRRGHDGAGSFDDEGPDHFEPYRPYDPTAGLDDDDEPDAASPGLIAGPDANDADLIEDDAENTTVDCPMCGHVIWGEAERCTLCGEWLTIEQIRSGHRLLRWRLWIAAVALTIAATLLSLIGLWQWLAWKE